MVNFFHPQILSFFLPYEHDRHFSSGLDCLIFSLGKQKSRSKSSGLKNNGRNRMHTQMFVGILFWFFFLPFKLYLLWVNYKGRFRYGLWEHSSIWRKLDKKIGVFSLAVDFVLTIMILFVLSALISVLFAFPTEIALGFVLFGAIGGTFVNVAFDRLSVDVFEKNCLKCEHKKECLKFVDENCGIEPLKQRSRRAVLYKEKLGGKKEMG